jgi:hypothetical protein
LVEYIILVGTIALACVGAFRVFGATVRTNAERQASCIRDLDGSCSGRGSVGEDGPITGAAADDSDTNGGSPRADQGKLVPYMREDGKMALMWRASPEPSLGSRLAEEGRHIKLVFTDGPSAVSAKVAAWVERQNLDRK